MSFQWKIPTLQPWGARRNGYIHRLTCYFLFQTPKKALHVSFELSPHHERSVVGNDDRRRSLLGYDWIAGMLDNTSYLSEKPDDYFDDLKEFRRVNKEDCCGKTGVEWVIEVIKIVFMCLNHCILGYRLSYYGCTCVRQCVMQIYGK